MQLSERMMVERYELGDAQQDSALRSHGDKAVTAFTISMVALAGLLIAGTVEVFEGWAHLVVIGALLTTLLGLIVAVSPTRRG
jgi:hypothetical protein